MREPTAEQFLKDVENHHMNILHSDGIYRHVRFRSDKCGWNQWFEIVTWPGKLTLSGDMGTWTFARIEDMFGFFRSKDLKINPSYWSEKLEGGNGVSRESTQFDPDVFKERLLACVDDYSDDEELVESIKATIECDVNFDDGEYEAHSSAREFRYEKERGCPFTFDELPSGNIYSFRFIWCLYAIVWGIRKFEQGDGATFTEATQKEAAQ